MTSRPASGLPGPSRPASGLPGPSRPASGLPGPSRPACGEPGRWELHADVVVVGGGVAGLTAARTASAHGLRVVVLSKGGPTDTATQYAQGGVAVVAPEDDSIESHVHDTLEAGVGLCDLGATRSIVSAGPEAVTALTELGAVFDAGRDGGLARTREGGHSTRRIIHAGGDATGAEVQRTLNSVGIADAGRTVGTVLFDTAVLEVVVGDDGVQGVIAVSDNDSDGPRVGLVHAPAVVLATGGLGQLYACSTNPSGATADGIALALRAGAVVADLEFVQFHPTVLYTAGGRGRRPLISEAVRGEGARLVDTEGYSVTDGVHPRGDLAPRDVVSRAIARRMAQSGADHVYLDATGIAGFAQRFPTITAACNDVGIDPTRDLIPVAPAAHYQCGGVVTDIAGRTHVPGLYAAGEVARTGLHGANRLASNSLLEGLVLGARVGEAVLERAAAPGKIVAVPEFTVKRMPRAALQELMTVHAGVVRDEIGLHEATRTINRTIDDHSASAVAGYTVESVEDAALTMTARAMLLAAAARTESRGCHTRSDHPDARDELRHSIPVGLGPDGEPRLLGRDALIPTRWDAAAPRAS